MCFEPRTPLVTRTLPFPSNSRTACSISLTVAQCQDRKNLVYSSKLLVYFFSARASALIPLGTPYGTRFDRHPHISPKDACAPRRKRRRSATRRSGAYQPFCATECTADASESRSCRYEGRHELAMKCWIANLCGFPSHLLTQHFIHSDRNPLSIWMMPVRNS